MRNIPCGAFVLTDRQDDVDTDQITTLAERARRRDDEALTRLCSEFYPRVLKFMHYRVGPRFAEDLTSEVFLRVVRAIGTQSGSFPAWLFRIAANVAIDHGRTSQVRRETSMTEAVQENAASGHEPAAAVGRALDIQHALAQLTDEQRELVTLKFIEGLSNAEITEATGRTPGAIRILQFRALAAMKVALSHEEPGNGTRA